MTDYVYVVVAGTGFEGPDTVVAATTTKAAALVLARNVPDGYINKVSLVDSTSAAYKAADEWHDQNPGWKVTR